MHLPNEVFNTVVRQLEPHVGDILAMGLAKKALMMVGATPDKVTAEQMQKALRMHIGPSLTSFMSPDKSRQVLRQIDKRIRGAA